MTIANAPALIAGKLASAVLTGVLGRTASAGPGLVANALSPRLLPSMLGGFAEGLVVVTGSSGKSTTAKMLTAVLREHGLTVFTNASTANLRQGVASALVHRSTLLGRIPAQIAVVELDEAAAASLAPDLAPRFVVVTNVMEEQLDRFYSAQRVASFLAAIARRATEGVVANGDDDLVRHLARDIRVPLRWFGTDVAVRPAGGLGYARTAATGTGVAGTVVQAVDDRIAVLDVHGRRLRVRLPARGVHYAADAAAAVETARAVLGDRFDQAAVARAFDDLRPVFGRNEIVTVGGEQVECVLVQNTSSFQLNLDQLQHPEQVLVAVGADVRDASWLWSVDTTALGHVAVVSGSKAFEVATRLAYDAVRVDTVLPRLEDALRVFLALDAPATGRKTIVFTAEPMRRIRTHLGLAEAAA
jgi:UDP-N-acetylmuramyl tripeptide synthase